MFVIDVLNTECIFGDVHFNADVRNFKHVQVKGLVQTRLQVYFH